VRSKINLQEAREISVKQQGRFKARKKIKIENQKITSGQDVIEFVLYAE